MEKSITGPSGRGQSSTGFLTNVSSGRTQERRADVGGGGS